MEKIMAVSISNIDMYISSIDRYLDGGTIAIFGQLLMDDMKILASDRQPMITIDHSLGTETPGKWFFGWKKDGKPIEDQDLIHKVKEKLKEWIKIKQNYIEQII